jgi:RNA polymerase sigma factor (sigma-70 family)
MPDGPNARAVGARTGAFFTAHGRMVFAVCRAILHNTDEAEDATQATFLSAHEALLKGATIRDPGAWLAMIARNECRARLRGRGSEPLPLRAECITSALTAYDDVERRTTVEHLRGAIASLPEKQREAVVLRDIYGLHYGEIGIALGVSRPSVEALLFRARRTLRIRLRPVAGGALAVPLAVREGLAQAIPWFATTHAGTVGVTGAGAGIVTKLAWPMAAKIAVAVAAVGVVGTAVTTHRAPAVVGVQASALPTVGRPATVAGAAEVRRFQLPAASAVVSNASTRTSPSAPGLAETPRRAPVPERLSNARVSSRGVRVPEPFAGTRPAREADGTSSPRLPSGTQRAPVPAPIRLSVAVAERAPTRAATPVRSAPEAALFIDEGETTTTTTAARTEVPEPDSTRADELAPRGR